MKLNRRVGLHHFVQLVIGLCLTAVLGCSHADVSTQSRGGALNASVGVADNGRFAFDADISVTASTVASVDSAARGGDGTAREAIARPRDLHPGRRVAAYHLHYVEDSAGAVVEITPQNGQSARASEPELRGMWSSLSRIRMTSASLNPELTLRDGRTIRPDLSRFEHAGSPSMPALWTSETSPTARISALRKKLGPFLRNKPTNVAKISEFIAAGDTTSAKNATWTSAGEQFDVASHVTLPSPPAVRGQRQRVLVDIHNPVLVGSLLPIR